MTLNNLAKQVSKAFEDIDVIQEQIKNDPSIDRVNVESSQRESFLKRWEKEKNIAIQTNQGSLYRNVIQNLSSIGEKHD